MPIDRVPVVRQLIILVKRIKLPWLQGLSLYDLLHLYITGLVKGTFSNRAGAIAFSFFMALFPFALFILNLIPYIPIDGFQDDFMKFIAESLPPTTYEAVSGIIDDILNNSYQGLLSTGFLLSIFLSANGINAVLGGFETSYHVSMTRSILNTYLLSLLLSLVLTLILIFTVAGIIASEVLIARLNTYGEFAGKIPLIQWSRYLFGVLLIFVTTSLLFKLGCKQTIRVPFISIGSVMTTLLVVLSSYLFGIYVVKFAKYNELYGSIGTLLIVMFYIWINCMILLMGFELNAAIDFLKRQGRKVEGK